MRWDLIGLCAAAIVILSATLLQKPNPNLLRFDVEGTRAYGYGHTDGRSQDVINTLIRQHPDVDTLVFVAMPGTQDLTSNYHLARSIRRAGLNTELRADSRIASGAVDLFLAGTQRTVACGAMIGVHAWGAAGFDAQDAWWDTHRSTSRGFLSDMGIDPDFYDFRTEAAGTESIHWLTPAEINRWGVASEPIRCDQSK
jgi:hypothetical protein